MAYRKKSVSVVMLILVVISVLFMGARAKRDNVGNDTGLGSLAPQFAVRGPFLVGTRELVLKSEKRLEGAMWYPTINADGREGAIKYPYGIKMGDPLGTVTFATFTGQAIQDGSYNLSAGPYPLVVLSPGFSISSTTYAWLAEHLASRGFVVLATEHHEHLDPENELWRSAIVRPQDILSLFAYIDGQVEPGGALEGLIDVDRVAVIGHSYGGYTSLAAAGAQIDTAAFRSQCESAYETNEPGAWLCEQLLPRLPEMASLGGLDTIPEGLWPAWSDPRVDAIVSMAGDAFFFGQGGLAKINVPVMAIGGTSDRDSPYRWSTHPTYEYASSAKKVRVALEGAEHMIFTGPCENITWYLKFFSDEFCSDPGWDRRYAHDLVKHFSTAFLLAELKGDPAASAALAPEVVDFAEITYDTQGY